MRRSAGTSGRRTIPACGTFPAYTSSPKSLSAANDIPPHTAAGGQSIHACLRGCFRFGGRAGRGEFWWWVLTNLLVGFLGALSGPLYVVLVLGLFIPGPAVTSRRLHDRGWSGWWQVLPYGLAAASFVPPMVEGPYGAMVLLMVGGVASSVWIVVMMALPGDTEPNAYGDPWPPASGA